MFWTIVPCCLSLFSRWWLWFCGESSDEWHGLGCSYWTHAGRHAVPRGDRRRRPAEPTVGRLKTDTVWEHRLTDMNAIFIHSPCVWKLFPHAFYVPFSMTKQCRIYLIKSSVLYVTVVPVPCFSCRIKRVFLIEIKVHGSYFSFLFMKYHSAPEHDVDRWIQLDYDVFGVVSFMQVNVLLHFLILQIYLGISHLI